MTSDTCSECGRPTGYLMQIDPAAPGLLEHFRDFASDTPSVRSVLVVIACCALFALILAGVMGLA